MINLITGYAGEPHVTSNQDGLCNAGIFGENTVILPVLDQFDYEINGLKLVIKSGVLVNQGRFVCIDYGDSEELQFEPVQTGETRVDYVCISYERNLLTGVETVSLNIKSEGNIEKGDILKGANFNDIVLYKVTVKGTQLENSDVEVADPDVVSYAGWSIYKYVKEHDAITINLSQRIQELNNKVKELENFERRFGFAIKEYEHDLTPTITCPANTVTTHNVTFSTEFSGVPHVQATFNTDSTAKTFGRVSLSIVSRSTTGVVFKIYNGSEFQRTPKIEYTAMTVDNLAFDVKPFDPGIPKQ